MSDKLFGTDGIRQRANTEPMTADTALRVAMAAAHVYRPEEHRPLVLIGKDTRSSGYMLEHAMTAGFTSMGMDVVLSGPVPTPAVATLTRSLRCDIGVVISASHNAFEDNGIKLFTGEGFKLPDAVEEEITAFTYGRRPLELSAPDEIGGAKRLDDAGGRYIEIVKSTFPRGLRLDGLKVVVDCAHGAAYKVAPRILYELGAEVIPMGVAPNGRNINSGCGATEPQGMQERVVAEGAHLGVALDGDADRVILADERGRIIDGDQIMALLAREWHGEGRIAGGSVVATVMSNLGLERYVKTLGLELSRTPVGDRFVAERMRDSGCNLGGEQSGHIILGDYSTTGDGLICALQVLACMVQRDTPASSFGRIFEPVPQLLKNVRFDPGQVADPLRADAVKAAIAEQERNLADCGRLLVRASGTEPKIRVMAEGDDRQRVTDAVDKVAAAVRMVGGQAAAE